METIKKIWNFLKSVPRVIYGIIVGVVGALAILFISRPKNGVAKDINKLIGISDEANDAVDRAREEEKIRREENSKKLENELSKIKEQYEAQKHKIDDDRQQEIEDLVRTYSDDPNELAKKLSEKTGFVIVLPTE